MFELLALFFFAAASFGFIYFTIKYPRSSEGRRLGIRICHAFGFAGVAILMLTQQDKEQVGLLILLSLLVSFIAFELSIKYLR